MISPNRASSFIQPFVVVLGLLCIVSFIYSYVSDDDYEDDEFTVTITYDCERVLNGRDYPNEVLKECLDLRNEIKRRNNT